MTAKDLRSDAKQLHTVIKKDKKYFLNYPIRYLRVFLHMHSFALQQHKPFWLEFPFYSSPHMDVRVAKHIHTHTSSLSCDYAHGQDLDTGREGLFFLWDIWIAFWLFAFKSTTLAKRLAKKNKKTLVHCKKQVVKMCVCCLTVIII